MLTHTATVGIESANNVNQCSSARILNNSICENEGTLANLARPINDTSTEDPRTVDPSLQQVDEKEYLYWLAGATGFGVLWSVLNTFALLVLVAVFVWFHKEEEAEKKDKKKSESPEG